LPRSEGVAGSRAALAVVVLLACIVAGCATGTRSGRLGHLGVDESLVSLLVSEDPGIVRHECPLAAVAGNVLGCQTSRTVALPTGGTARAVRIVRYTDRLPSPLAFEIDLHELCHAVATVQGLDDPCHIGNEGIAQQPYASPRALFGR
jgi:hypothetical protein